MSLPLRLLSLFLLPLYSLSIQLHAGVQLNENSFDQLTSSGLWFIENFSPFCPHCKKFAPRWVELVDTMKPYESQGLQLGQIDCIAQGDLCIKLKVDFYPQLKLFEDGKFIEHYTGDKTVEAIKSYLEPKLEAYKSKHKPPAAFEPEPVVLEPEAAAQPIEEIQHESPLATAHDHQSGWLHHQQNPDQFVQAEAPNRDGKVVRLDASNWPQYTHLHHSGHPILIHYHTAWCKECRTLKPVVAEAAALLINQVNVGEFDCEHKTTKEICTKEGLIEFPAFLLYHDGVKLVFTGEKTANGLADFARQVAATAGFHEINAQELDYAIRTNPLFFLFLHSSNTPLGIVNAVQTVGKSFMGSATVLKSDHAEVFEKLSIPRDHAYLAVFKEYDPTPWAKIAIRDADGREEPSSEKRLNKLTIAIRHWVALNSVPLLDELTNANFYRVLNSGAKKFVVLACLSGMSTDANGGLDYAQSNPKSIQLREDMKVWAHQWRKSQEARGVNDLMVDWVWVNAEQWAGWLYHTYGINLPPPKDDPKESSMIVIVDASNHKYYDTQENGLDIQFKPSSVFQTLLGVEMEKLSGKLTGTRWGRMKWRIYRFKQSIGFMFQPSWMIFWLVLVAVVWFSLKTFAPASVAGFGPRLASHSPKNGFPAPANDMASSAGNNQCKSGFGQVFGLSSNLPFKAD